ncbi:uncharacterized protein [Henckelia pumila]|uniref:uncharacterized protein n=1 Tax=Henckelia pumila TaxID=405737 RepID=UPI003C6E900C
MTIIDDPESSRRAVASIQEQVDAMVDAALQKIMAIQQGEKEGQRKDKEKEVEGEGEPGPRPEKEKSKGIHVEDEGNSHAGSTNVTMAGELEMLKQKIQKLENTDPRESARIKSLGCPFSPEIIGEPLPVYFKSAKIKEYDGSADPEEHVTRFENVAMLHCYGDQIKCKVFLTTLVDSAQRWFENLEEGSIKTFKEFREVFLQHFSSSKRYKKTTLSLFEIKQLNEESLRAYIKKFNRVALEVPACAPETKITAFTQGLREGEFFRSLEAQRQKREKDRREEQKERGNQGSQGRRRQDQPGRLAAFAPHRVARDREIHLCEENVQLLPPKRPGKYCSIHRVNTHDTSKCRRLVVEPGQPVPEETKHVEKKQRGRPWVPRFDISRDNRPDPSKAREVASRGPDKGPREGSSKGVINMTSGGSTDGDSNRARKSWSKREVLGIEARRPDPCPVVTFGPEDLEGVCLPHNDALLIRAQVANYDIRRVFVDSGSSVNVIFQDAFEQMDLRGCEVNPVKKSLYGFAGHIIRPKGEVRLPITLGSGDIKKTVMALFTVVEAPSSYNIILGRPALNAFRAVSFAYHQKIKFPVGDRVGEVKGDQHSSRRCYADTIRVDNKRARGTERRDGSRQKEVCAVEEVKEENEEVEVVPGQPGKITRVARGMEPSLVEQLKICLTQNADVFAWSPKELTGVPDHLAEHRLNILSGSRLVRQKKRHFGGYHQIPLAREDQDKVSFVTSGGTFCYVVMPFGLKNAGATYQRMMDRVFKNQLGRNVEVYVDDILVKSRTRNHFIPDLEETFGTLRRYGVKLNPAKCVFGVKSRKFLGFVVTKRGIEVNPEKVKILREMPSPSSIREVQRLTGRVTALSRFVARSAHRSHPFFQVLRKAQIFGWSEDCERAFQELKEHMENLPILVKPEPGERLWVYISMTEFAVSTVLIKEEGGDKKPVYYVSHALKGPEIRYSEMEKMALALILTARKLRPYFLSHPVTVLTNSPLGRVMTQPDASGRLVKWAVELGEYDIEYMPRAAIKAQALSDFLTEVITFGQEEVWRIFVDGASSLEGSGVGVILISPTQEKTKVAIRLSSFKSNNEAEYEAVISGLKLAREAGARHVIVYSDSQLVVQQVQGTFSIREKRLQEYVGLIKQQGEEFSSWIIEQIPRDHNAEADALARVASSLTGIDSREVIQQSGSVIVIEEREEEASERSWMAPLVEYLQTGILPGEEAHARKLRRQVARFTLINEKLYRRSFQGPLLRFLAQGEVRYVLQEIHEGYCGDHGGALSLVRRTLLAGYWWPTLQQDARQPAAELQPMWASCPFDQWGMDIVGPFPVGPGQKKFLLVAVDYFSKWVEAEPLARITEEAVLGFIWKNIVCRFGLPRKLVSDNGRQFQGKKIKDWCTEMMVKQVFTSVAYPQSNGQTEVTNRTIIQTLQTRLFGAGKSWVEEVPGVLWSYRTTPRTATGETPFSLVYGSEAVIPVEIGQTSPRVRAHQEGETMDRTQELDLIEEKKERAAIQMEAYRSRIVKAFNQKVKTREFQIGDLVLKKVNSAGGVKKL